MHPNNYIRFLTIVLAFAVGCNRQASAPSGNASSSPAPVISVIKPEKKPVKRVVEQPGTIQAFEETVLYPKIAGYIQVLSLDPFKTKNLEHDRFIDIGSRVKKDQILAELSVPELEEEYKQKEALIRQAEAEVAQAKKALAASVAAVNAAKALVEETKAGLTRTQAMYDRWRSEADRVTRLVSGGVIDSQTRDETLNQFKAAEASRTESLAKVTSSEATVAKAEADRDKFAADVTAAEARLDVAKADARRVDVLRGYTRIKSPFDGVITRRMANTGDFMTADGKHGLFSVARLNPVRVVVHVPEADAGLVEVGQEVRIVLQTMVSSPMTGKVVRTSWSLEPGSRTLRTEVDLPNIEGNVRPGMYVSARLLVELPAEWAIPATAVGKINEEPVIYLVESGKAVRVIAQLYRGDGQWTQIRRYKRPDRSDWIEITGEEKIASPAASISDGQAIP